MAAQIDDPVVRALIEAINAGDREAFYAVAGDRISRIETGRAGGQ